MDISNNDFVSVRLAPRRPLSPGGLMRHVAGKGQRESAKVESTVTDCVWGLRELLHTFSPSIQLCILPWSPEFGGYVSKIERLHERSWLTDWIEVFHLMQFQGKIFFLCNVLFNVWFSIPHGLTRICIGTGCSYCSKISRVEDLHKLKRRLWLGFIPNPAAQRRRWGWHSEEWCPGALCFHRRNQVSRSAWPFGRRSSGGKRRDGMHTHQRPERQKNTINYTNELMKFGKCCCVRYYAGATFLPSFCGKQ